MEKILEDKLLAIEKLVREGKIETALSDFEKLSAENPQSLTVKLSFADLLLKTDEPFKALRILREGMKIDSEALDLRYLLAIAQLKACRFNLAEKEFEFLQVRQPASLIIKKQLGWVKIMKGELEQGRNILREVISADITNSDPYMDLGMSFVGSLDFEEAFRWLETAKSLNPKDRLVLQSIEHAKKMQKGFAKLSAKEKETFRQARNDPKFLKEEAIKQVLSFSANVSNLSQEDLEDTRRELQLAGFNPNFGTFSEPTTQAEKEQVEYLQYHQKVPNVERKISLQEFENLKANLLNPKLLPEETKTILIALGHQGTKEALALLKEYCKEAPKSLQVFARMALQECKVFSQKNHSKIIPFSI